MGHEDAVTTTTSPQPASVGYDGPAICAPTTDAATSGGPPQKLTGSAREVAHGTIEGKEWSLWAAHGQPGAAGLEDGGLVFRRTRVRTLCRLPESVGDGDDRHGRRRDHLRRRRLSRSRQGADEHRRSQQPCCRHGTALTTRLGGRRGVVLYRNAAEVGVLVQLLRNQHDLAQLFDRAQHRIRRGRHRTGVRHHQQSRQHRLMRHGKTRSSELQRGRVAAATGTVPGQFRRWRPPARARVQARWAFQTTPRHVRRRRAPRHPVGRRAPSCPQGPRSPAGPSRDRRGASGSPRASRGRTAWRTEASSSTVGRTACALAIPIRRNCSSLTLARTGW